MEEENETTRFNTELTKLYKVVTNSVVVSYPSVSKTCNNGEKSFAAQPTVQLCIGGITCGQ